ncbi:unnamed protein product [Leptosia nina]|uniref:3'-5' exonuclease domain-containing protein n=1 Tax=Leptosia nina TaxID=320188 RepID=A0AAV1JKV8_9NEOP
MNLSDLCSSSHQSVKIVPSIEDSLKAIGLDTHLSEEVKLWFNQLQVTWQTWRKSSAVENIFNLLYNFEEPHRIALACTIKCQEFKDCKPKSLPYYIIESLQKWCEVHKRPPKDSLKLPAFHIAAMQRNQQFLIMVVKTFNIKTIKSEILPLVKDIMKNDDCKQASQIVSALELYDDIPIEDLIFPLILQDKINVIDEYLTDSPGQVRPLLEFLDSLLNKKCAIRDYVQKFLEDHKVYNIKYEKIHHKPLGKLVARLCSKYNVPVDTCQNLSKNRTTGGLKYLIYQKYVEHNVSASVWDDLVKDSLNRAEGCAEEFINMLVDYDHGEAIKWATYSKIEDSKLPLALQNLSIKENSTEVQEENWENKENSLRNYYELSIDKNSIVIIDAAEKFYDLLTSIRTCNLVSIDCEWKPSFGAVQSQVALIQIATPISVYLIDTFIFNEKQYASFWYQLNKSLFENDEIIKLGFGLEQDLKEIKASVAGLQNIKIKGEGLLDLSTLWKSLTEYGLYIPNSSDIEGHGLSSIVQICFGVPLEKSEQCSNWELRPLRNTQIYYAALDAFVLLEIYNYLQTLCTEQNINFEEICNEVMLDKKPKNVKRCKANHKLEVMACNIPKTAIDLSLLVEADLSYLIGYLRYCGIDTVVMPSKMVWHDAIDLALSEDRNILTSKLKLTCSSKYPQNSILYVEKGNIKDQIKKIYTTFYVVITQADLFKRCLYCNCVDLRTMNFKDFLDIYNKCQMLESTQTARSKYNSDDFEDDPLDDFFSDSDEDEKFISHPICHNQSEKCVTSKGALIDLSNLQKVYSFYHSNQNKSVLLCENCGKFYWEEEESIKSISEIVSQFVNNDT